ncbi:hypothetical protein D9V41_03215 [Aeromicrobium phragmitis]|uniref:Uncharacterized protein n=1 Tax=Aeromicrobium phragmitis TaxID=2478914 RepID=A0A3L8PS59_9ACTN|nr:hypothetical protein [Aeromicrobium phragmitis]RLV56802.1 hypothetical protein D9V41_03215 [Aeromicrobium phragmitis]
MSDTSAGRLLLGIAGLVSGLQGLALVVLAVADLAHLGDDRLGLGIGIAVVLIVLGAGLLAAAAGVALARQGARGPVLVAQLIALGLAWNLRGAEDSVVTWLQPLLVVTAVIVLGCLLSGPGRRAMSLAIDEE